MGERHAYMMGVPLGYSAGHYCRQKGPVSPWGHNHYILYDWHPDRDGPAYPRRKRRYGRETYSESVEGEFVHVSVDGWTLIACWDRSADKRGGCTMTFAFSEVMTGEDAVALARSAWPGIFERIEAHTGNVCTVRD